MSNQYILFKSALKMLELCRHYGLPLTKILATPLFDKTISFNNTCSGSLASADEPDVILPTIPRTFMRFTRAGSNFTTQLK